MSQVRAKFKVSCIESRMGSKPSAKPNTWEPVEQRTVVLTPVYNSDPASENGQFWAATPSGEIRLGTISPAAWEAFVLDAEYYVEFTPAKIAP